MITLKIAITGGPCAGKTSAMKFIINHLNKMGISVVIVPETATEMINGGITPQNIGQTEFQKNLLQLQLKKEEIYKRTASKINNDTVIIFDRGTLDGKAYLDDNQFNKILQELNINESDLISSYDAVFFLESTAKNNYNNYTVSNNSARTETAEEACIISEKTLNVWKKHPNLIIINNESEFEEKINNLLSEIDKLIVK